MKPPQVLVVEDDRFFRQLIRDELTAAGFEVTNAVDAAAAREAISGGTADVMLLDYLLPDGTGIDVWSYTRRVNPRLAGRTIMVTAVLNVEDRRELEALTKAPVLTKPFEGEDLVEMVKRVVADAPEDHGGEGAENAGEESEESEPESPPCPFCNDTRTCHHCGGTGTRIRKRRWLGDKVSMCAACEGAGRCALCGSRDAPKYR